MLCIKAVWFRNLSLRCLPSVVLMGSRLPREISHHIWCNGTGQLCSSPGATRAHCCPRELRCVLQTHLTPFLCLDLNTSSFQSTSPVTWVLLCDIASCSALIREVPSERDKGALKGAGERSMNRAMGMASCQLFLPRDIHTSATHCSFFPPFGFKNNTFRDIQGDQPCFLLEKKNN